MNNNKLKILFLLLYPCILISEEVKLLEDTKITYHLSDADKLDIEGMPDQYELVRQFTSDHRYKVAGLSVGLIQIKKAGDSLGKWHSVCSATLISDDYVITSNHCFYENTGYDEQVKIDLEGIRIKFGYLYEELGDEDVVNFKEKAQEVWDLVIAETGDSSPVEELDYMILRIKQDPRKGPPTERFQKIEVFAYDPIETEELFIIHHPGGLSQRLTRSECRSHRLSSDSTIRGSILPYNCKTAGGTSGAPIFADRVTEGIRHKGGGMVAIHHGRIKEKNISVGIRMSQIVSQSKILSELSCIESALGVPCQ